MRIVFMGTPAFAVPAFEALLADGHEILAAVAQPDRPRGRGLTPAAPPIAQAARHAGVPVLQPERVRDPAFLATIEKTAPDLIVVVAFGQILPKQLLDLPPRGCVNVHASLLPRYRGAAPIQWAILRGEKVTGVTTMMMNERMDAGDVLLSRETPIAPDETAGALSERLSGLGADLLVETLRALEAGGLRARPQDETRATLAPRLRKDDGRVRWADAECDVLNRIRAVTPWPGATTASGGGSLKIWAAAAGEQASGGAKPGTILRADAAGILVATGEGGTVRLFELQAPGRKRLCAAEFLRGTRLAEGQVLGPA
jgi:methionyl-tRNA formyltransferase